MHKFSFKVIAVFVSVLSVFGVLSVPVAQVNSVEASSYFDQYITNTSDYYFTRGSVTVNNITVQELYEFTSNAENDVYWYPGVLSSVKTSPTTYEQTIYTGAGTVTSYLEILATVPNTLVVQKATGAFENYAVYVYTPTSNGARLTIYSAVKKAEGITEETLETILNLTFPTLLDHLDKTGTYSVLVI